MQRWHLTLGLSVAAIGAAVVVPDAQFSAQPQPPSLARPPAPPPVDTTHPTPAGLQEGRVHVRAALDQGTLLAQHAQERFVVIEVTADSVQASTRQPVHMAVVLDTSGSMAGQGKMAQARAAAQELVGLLGPEDSFSLVTFDDQAQVQIPSQPVVDASNLQRRIGNIRTGGGTNLHGGLTAGVAEVLTGAPNMVRRVVVLSDGQANIGITDPLSLQREAGMHIRDGVTVSALGLGLDYNEDLLAAMADAGGGSYRFVDSPGQLAALFTEELQRATQVVGRQSILSLDVADGVTIQEVYGYDIQQSKDGYSVLLGDLYAGETRKLVARVHIPARAGTELAVANIRVDHLDADAGTPKRATHSLVATLTEQVVVAERSRNKDATKQATRAQVGHMVDEAARAFARGDVTANQAAYDKALGLVETFNADFEDADMLGSLGYLQQEQKAYSASSPESASGRAQVKKAKEDARDWTRR